MRLVAFMWVQVFNLHKHNPGPGLIAGQKPAATSDGQKTPARATHRLGLGRRIDPNAPPVLYWLRLERDGSGGARHAAEKIDDDSGVGTQVAVAKKRGMFEFTQK
jgi:hypothetical protein